jgi:hypothetical protein
MGLDYSSYEAKIDKKNLYLKGKHLIGIGHEFIKYP